MASVRCVTHGRSVALAHRAIAANTFKLNPRFASSLPVPHREQLFINNSWRNGEGGKTFTVYNPANEEELFQCARASGNDVDEAVRGARDCFYGPSWGMQSTGKYRGDILRKMGALLREKKEE